MTPLTVRRSGQAPLRFEGALLTQASSHHHGTPLENRWHEIEVHEIEGGRRYVVTIRYRTLWQGESDHDEAHVADTPADVTRLLTGYDPLAHVIGYPADDSYAEKQRRLSAAIRAGYDDAVSFALADERFAEEPADDRDADYRRMDAECLAEFVRAQLADLGLTRAEACAVCDANNGAMLIGPVCWQGVAANVEDTPAELLSEKWDCDALALARRIAAADRGTQFALAWAVAQFWRHTDLPTDEALKLAGFSVPAE
jgi:hypothetical protein